MKKGKLLVTIIILAIIFGLIYATILTVEPSLKASKVCFLGYKAHCSFTPISTVLCILSVVPFAFYLKRTLGDLRGR
jgi:hypothetical protein